MATITIALNQCLICDMRQVEAGDNVLLNLDPTKFTPEVIDGYSPVPGAVSEVRGPEPPESSEATMVIVVEVSAESLPPGYVTLEQEDIESVVCVACCERLDGAVSDLADRVTQNEADIATNVYDIAYNKSLAEGNSASIGQNTLAINQNSALIQFNSDAINLNKTDIQNLQTGKQDTSPVDGISYLLYNGGLTAYTAPQGSTGGNGIADGGLFTKFRSDGSLATTGLLRVFDGTEGPTWELSLVSGNQDQGLVAKQGTFYGTLTFPLLTASASYILPDFSGDLFVIRNEPVDGGGFANYGQISTPGTDPQNNLFVYARDNGEAGILRGEVGGVLDDSVEGVMFSDHGTKITGTTLQSSVLASGGNAQVFADAEGRLYTVDPDEGTGWSESASDTGDYDLGTQGDGGPWVKITGLEVTVPDITLGERIDVFTSNYIVNKTDNRDGTIAFAFGLNGAAPTSAGTSVQVNRDFEGTLPLNVSSDALATSAGDTLAIWARVSSGTNNAFGVDIENSVSSGQLTVSHTPSPGVASQSSVQTLTGWAAYSDTVYTSGSPLTVNNARVKVLIDGLGAATNKTQLPSGVTDFWDSTTNKIVAYNENDSFSLRLSYKCSNGSSLAYFDQQLDIGGGLGVIAEETVQVIKGAGITTRAQFSMPFYTGSTFVANGGELYFDTSVSGDNITIWDITLLIEKIHHGI